MTAPQTFHGIVASRPEQTVLDDDRGIIFWVQTDDDPHTDAAQVFLSATRADQVEGLDLGDRVGAHHRGSPARQRRHLRLGPAAGGAPPRREVGCWAPSRSTSPTWRASTRVASVATSSWCGAVWRPSSCWVSSAMVKSSVVGNIGFIFFLLWGAVLVWGDLRTRKIDDREYAALSNDVVTAVRSRLNIDVPPQAVFDMLGGGLERTGNPWRPMRPRRTGPAYWVAEAVAARLAVDITPQPLQPNAPATITVVAVDEDHPA